MGILTLVDVHTAYDAIDAAEVVLPCLISLGVFESRNSLHATLDGTDTKSLMKDRLWLRRMFPGIVFTIRK